MAIGPKKQLQMEDRDMTPDVIKLGHAVRLFSVKAGAILLTIDEETMKDSLKAMQVPTVEIKGKMFFNIAAFEKAVYFALEPGRKSWSMGKNAKNMKDLGYFEQAAMVYSNLDTWRLKERVRKAAHIMVAAQHLGKNKSS